MRTELDSIVEQIGNDLLKPRRISYGVETRWTIEDNCVSGLAAVPLKHGVNQSDQIDPFSLNAQLPRP